MPEPNRLLPMLSDQPAEDDLLNFDPYAKTLAEIVADPGTRTPLTIGVFGDWGYGKTSLMQMVRKRLRATAGTDFPVHAVWFNAWLYSREQVLWRALTARVMEGARQFPTLSGAHLAQLDRLEGRLYQAAEPEGGRLAGGQKQTRLPPAQRGRMGKGRARDGWAPLSLGQRMGRRPLQQPGERPRQDHARGPVPRRRQPLRGGRHGRAGVGVVQQQIWQDWRET